MTWETYTRLFPGPSTCTTKSSNILVGTSDACVTQTSIGKKMKWTKAAKALQSVPHSFQLARWRRVTLPWMALYRQPSAGGSNAQSVETNLVGRNMQWVMSRIYQWHPQFLSCWRTAQGISFVQRKCESVQYWKAPRSCAQPSNQRRCARSQLLVQQLTHRLYTTLRFNTSWYRYTWA